MNQRNSRRNILEEVILATDYLLKKSFNLSLYALNKILVWGSIWSLFFLPFEHLQTGINLFFNIGKLWVFCWIILSLLEFNKDNLKGIIGSSILVFFLTLFLFFRGPMTLTSNFLIPKLTYVRDATFNQFKNIQSEEVK